MYFNYLVKNIIIHEIYFSATSDVVYKSQFEKLIGESCNRGTIMNMQNDLQSSWEKACAAALHRLELSTAVTQSSVPVMQFQSWFLFRSQYWCYKFVTCVTSLCRRISDMRTGDLF